MKVLFASLARIGDYIQHLAVIRAWSLQNPDVDIHILINDLIPKDLIRMNSQFKHVILPRFSYQKKINQLTTPLLYPFLSLRQLVKQLRSEDYIQLFDLTYQSHSLAFLKLIKPAFGYSEKEVLFINDYLKISDSHHLIDKLKSIYEIDLSPLPSVGGQAQRIFFQILTSDAKKNVDLNKWRQLLDGLQRDIPEIQLSVLGSNQDRSQLSRLFNKDELFICNFSELAEQLTPNTRLVSLDTSIKHFAAQFQVPTIEISVGSSHWIKNAAYQSGNFIFSADFHCRPCVHSRDCPLGRNQCQDEINFLELQDFISHWVSEPNPVTFAMKTNVKNNELSIQKGEKWNPAINQTTRQFDQQPLSIN